MSDHEKMHKSLQDQTGRSKQGGNIPPLDQSGINGFWLLVCLCVSCCGLQQGHVGREGSTRYVCELYFVCWQGSRNVRFSVKACVVPRVERHKPNAFNTARGCVDPKLSADMPQQVQLSCNKSTDDMYTPTATRQLSVHCRYCMC